MNKSDFDIKQTFLLNCLKKISIQGLDDIDISHLMFNTSGYALKATTFSSFKKLIRTLFFNVIKIDYSFVNKSLPLVISFDYHRNDHKTYWEKFKNIVGNYNEMYIQQGKKYHCKLRKLSDIFFVLQNYLYIWRKLDSVKNPIVKRVIATSLAELIELKKYIDRLNNQERVALIFFDGGRVENFIVQNLRNKGVIVATMQHGQPVFHGLDCDRINQTMILNFSSDYIMVTGEFSKQQFLKGNIPEKSIFVGGSLREIKAFNDSGNYFSVFLDCPTNQNSVRDNNELIAVAKRIAVILDSKYVIKCHPQDTPENYTKFIDERCSIADKDASIKEILERKKFAILHASGVYIDIISEGIKAFCYINDTNFPLVEKGLDSFTSDDELIEKIKTWDSYELRIKQEHMNSIVNYYLNPQNVEQRYKNFVEKLNSTI